MHTPQRELASMPPDSMKLRNYNCVPEWGAGKPHRHFLPFGWFDTPTCQCALLAIWGIRCPLYNNGGCYAPKSYFLPFGGWANTYMGARVLPTPGGGSGPKERGLFSAIVIFFG